MTVPTTANPTQQTLIGAAVLIVSGLLAWGAIEIPAAAGYSGVGPNFLPWVVAAVLAICGGLLLWHARSGGWRELEAPSGGARGDWVALGWVSAGVLANAALVTRIGFVLSCTLCFALAVRGLRGSEGKPAGGLQRTIADVLVGLAIAAPVFWMFTKLLAINLPGITASGWL